MNQLFSLAALLILGFHGVAVSALPDKSEALSFIARANSYWQSNNAPTGRAFWDNAAYHTGNMEAWRVTGTAAYLDYSLQWSETNDWKGAKSTNTAAWRYDYGETDDHVLFGDWQICFQTYVDLYTILGGPRKIARAIEVMEYQMQTDANDYWWWADGLYMVMPVMTKLYKVTGNERYLEKLYEYFSYAKSIMYDEETGLFFRDAKYVYPQHTSFNGLKDFWARGDGWVFAGLAKILQDLPSDDPHRDEYLAIFRKMAETLADAQQSEGYWTRSLLDPEHAPGYETSGTAFYTYGYLWGINNGILDSTRYIPVVQSAWNYLTTIALQSNGRVGYVQPIGENAMPGQTISVQSTSNFGVGAFLLACAEMVRFAPGNMPFFVYSVTLDDPHRVTIRFNQKVEPSGATGAQQYSSDGLSIESATVLPDSSGVTLQYAAITPGQHSVTIGNVMSVSGDVLENSGPFSFVYIDSITVTASGYESGTANTPDKSLDGDLQTRWSADGVGQWLLFDLNTIKEVTSVAMAFYRGSERATIFSIELSTDGVRFDEVYSGQSGGMTEQAETFAFTPQEARYVRIIGNGNTENSWTSITEVSITANDITALIPASFGHRKPTGIQVRRTGASGLQIHYPLNTPNAVSIRIFNARGTLLLHRNVRFSNGYAMVNTVKLSPGVYYVAVGSGKHAAAPLLVR